MDDHAEKDKQFHARIAGHYDAMTNEPRQYPNELLFRPIDRLIHPARLLVDLGCGTGQMFLRYRKRTDRTIAVDHSEEMLEVAERRVRGIGMTNVEFVRSDVHDFLERNAGLGVNLVTCVGVLHHLKQHELETALSGISSILAGRGQCVIAEPVYSDAVPGVIRSRNERSILQRRLERFMPEDAVDPDEEPLHETSLRDAIRHSGLVMRKISRGFELFHLTDPITRFEKILIRAIYARYRHRGDVIAVLLEKPTG
ncbi:class I SAM-dependent methyltransferase [Elongatibacter sediminis]|uniref:Class I SAM-dependent methyltransferase n=1 Tax=Elongatibacter sediminis TaxID=3119006 RepID=A0AAW9RDV7_9GAMM